MVGIVTGQAYFACFERRVIGVRSGGPRIISFPFLSLSLSENCHLSAEEG